MKTTLSAIALAAALFAFAAPAQAGDLVITENVRVQYGDLDLSSERGAETMMRRLDRAATRACGGAVEPGPIAVRARQQRALDACRSQALDRAVAELAAPIVTAIYVDRTARTVSVAAR